MDPFPCTDPPNVLICLVSSQKYNAAQAHKSVHVDVFRMGDGFVPFPIFHTPPPATYEYGPHFLVHRFAHSPILQETIFPLNRKLLSAKYVQPVVNKYTTLTYQHLEERANRYNGMNVALKDFIVPLTFDGSSRAFFGKHCPVDDLFKPFKLLDDNIHLLMAGVPRMFTKGPVTALDDLVTIIEEKYLSKPDAMDDASDMVKELERVTKEGGFVSRSPTHGASPCFDGLPDRTPEMLLDLPLPSSGPSKRARHGRHTGSSHSTSNGRTVLDRWSQKSTRPSSAGTPQTHPSP